MSLILDALRRADAERGRGTLPGLHAPQAGPARAELSTGPARRGVAVGAAVAVAGMAVAAGAAWWWRAGSPPTPVTTAAVIVAPVLPAVVEAVPSPVIAAAPASAPAPVPVPAGPRIEPAGPVGSRAVAPVIVPAPFPAAPVAPAPAAAVAKPSQGDPAAALALTPTPSLAMKPPVAKTVVPLLQDIDPAVRQRLPQLAVAGASYSADPAYRMVIVNGQVMREGDWAAPGVLLESIGQKVVVLRGMGVRWGVPY